MPQAVWTDARQEAKDLEFRGEYHILGTDIDPASLSIAIANVKKAGVSNCIEFREGDATLDRYRLSVADILRMAEVDARAGYASLVLQGGEIEGEDSRIYRKCLFADEAERSRLCEIGGRRKAASKRFTLYFFSKSVVPLSLISYTP